MKLSIKTAIFVLIVSVIIIFAQSLSFNFTNWDDPAYITQNQLITKFDFNFIKIIFTQPMHGHYHPLTWISLALDYQFFGLNAWGFHLHNLLLHLLNTLLVFYFIRMLKTDIRIAFFTAFIFSVHPFANESVSWITERKNLLFTFFYLLAFISYIRYTKKQKTIFYAAGLVFFLLSLLSKGSALTLPLVLLVWLYYNHSFSKKELLKLLPYYAMMFIFAWAATKAQQPLISQTASLSFYDSILYSSWAFGLYVIKAFVPFQLAAFHPIFIDKLPVFYYFGLIIFLIIIFIAIKAYKAKRHDIVLGLFFFLANIVLFLKIFDAYASSYFMAERYTYLAYIGLYFAFFTYFFEKIQKKFVYFLILGWSLFLMLQSYKYAKTWENSITLWENVLSIYPTSDVALLNYGNALRQEMQYTKALETYKKISKQGDVFFKMLENRAFVYYKMNQFNEAVNDYAMLLEKYPKRKDLKQTIVNILLNQGNLNLAYHQLNYLLKEDSMLCDAWNSLGNYYSSLNKTDSALWAYKKALNCKQKPLYYFNRATLLSQNDKLDEAILDFDKAISLDSNVSDYYVNRAINYFKLKNYSMSLNDFNHAIILNPQNIDLYLNRCNVFMAINKWDRALEDLTHVLKLNPNDGNTYARRSFVYSKMGYLDKACSDAQKALQLGYKKYEAWAKQICK